MSPVVKARDTSLDPHTAGERESPVRASECCPCCFSPEIAQRRQECVTAFLVCNTNLQPCARRHAMSISITVRNGTAIGKESLCRTCRHAHIQLGYPESEEEVRCGYHYEGSPSCVVRRQG